jgi:hypothetical protein
MQDKRSSKRWPGALKGHIVLEDGRSLGCVISDFSAGGAKIKVADPVMLPACFEVSFPLTLSTFRAHVRWRAHNEIGVQFDSVGSPETLVPRDPVHAMLLERLFKAEAERTEMQERLAGLLSSLEHVG